MEILVEVRNHVAHVTLNRPAALNALSLDMIGALHEHLRRCAADAAIHAVLIRGAGGKAFCAGGDIRALYQSYRTAGPLSLREFFDQEYRLDQYLHTYPKPYIALLDGITMGGGMGIAQGSRLRVVGERTRMAMPEVGIGFFPDVGASYFLSRLPGSLGNYLALTGNSIGAADALYAGLADLYLPPPAIGALDAALDALEWSADPSGDAARTLRALASSDRPAAPLAALRPAIDLHFTKENVPAILASLHGESRTEYAGWARQTAELMATRSPTMLAVTVEQLRRGRSLGLADCFRMEAQIGRRAFTHGDFIEGVRALIIDKDQRPLWRPDRIEDVTDAMVDAFF